MRLTMKDAENAEWDNEQALGGVNNMLNNVANSPAAEALAEQLEEQKYMDKRPQQAPPPATTGQPAATQNAPTVPTQGSQDES